MSSTFNVAFLGGMQKVPDHVILGGRRAAGCHAVHQLPQEIILAGALGRHSINNCLDWAVLWLLHNTNTSDHRVYFALPSESQNWDTVPPS